MSPAGDLAGRKETEATLDGDSGKQKTKTTRCETEVVIFYTWRVAVSHQGRVRGIRKLTAYFLESLIICRNEGSLINTALSGFFLILVPF